MAGSAYNNQLKAAAEEMLAAMKTAAEMLAAVVMTMKTTMTRMRMARMTMTVTTMAATAAAGAAAMTKTMAAIYWINAKTLQQMHEI